MTRTSSDEDLEPARFAEQGNGSEGGAAPGERLKLMPAHLIDADGVTVIKRGRLELRLTGEDVPVVLGVILEETDGEGASADQICARFAGPDREYVLELIGYLRKQRLLVDAAEAPVVGSETPEAVYYWHFGRQLEDVRASLASIRIAILGVNAISRQLARSLGASASGSFKVLDVPMLRNSRMFDGEGELRAAEWPSELPEPAFADARAEAISPVEVDLVVATSDYGGVHELCHWNERCIERGIRFFPVVLKDLIGQVGPLVVPGETACFECVVRRRSSHYRERASRVAAEREARAGQQVVGFHPSMASILADVAVMELSKIYAMTPKWRSGTVVDVNLIASTMTPRKVLKLPRCPVCSNLHRRSSETATRFVFLPGNRQVT